jgi:hypothetical protein
MIVLNRLLAVTISELTASAVQSTRCKKSWQAIIANFLRLSLYWKPMLSQMSLLVGRLASSLVGRLGSFFAEATEAEAGLLAARFFGTTAFYQSSSSPPPRHAVV